MLFFHSLETLISPEVFAEVLCDDLDLPAAAFVPAVVQAIRQQIKQFDSDSEISLDKQTDQRVIIKVGCLEVLDNSLLLKLIIHVHHQLSTCFIFKCRQYSFVCNVLNQSSQKYNLLALCT